MSLQKILQLEVLLEQGEDPRIIDVTLSDIDPSIVENLSQEVKAEYNAKMKEGQVLKKKIFGDDKESIEWVLNKLGMIERPLKQKPIPPQSIGLTDSELFPYSDIKTFTEIDFYKMYDGKVYIPVIIAQELLIDRSCKIYYYREAEKNNSELMLYVFNLPNINTLSVKKAKSSELILLEDWLEFTENMSSVAFVDPVAPVVSGSNSVPIYYEVYGTEPFSDIIKGEIDTQKEVFIQGIHFKKFDDLEDKDFKQNQDRLLVSDNRFKLLSIESFLGVQPFDKDSYIPQLFGNKDTVYLLTEIESFLNNRPKPQPTLLSKIGFNGGNKTKKKKAVKKQFRKTLRQK